MLRMLFLLLVAVTLAPVADAGNLKANRIIVEKAKRQLTLYIGAKAVKTYRIALGGNPIGHKQQEGDSRTPEGKYTIDAKNPNSSFYKSLHISYPANRDRAQARRRGVSPGGGRESAVVIVERVPR